ncbi:GTP-binding protein, partial [Achromobacter xylosoxidans]
QPVAPVQAPGVADGPPPQRLETPAAAGGADLQSPERAAQRQDRAGRLAEARNGHDLLEQRLHQAQAALEAQRRELLEQDAQRYEKSAAIERDAHHRRHSEIQQLLGKVEQAGAQGVGERLSEAEAACERLHRRRDEFQRRAQALELLSTLLGGKRDAPTQRLQAPLARRL